MAKTTFTGGKLNLKGDNKKAKKKKSTKTTKHKLEQSENRKESKDETISNRNQDDDSDDDGLTDAERRSLAIKKERERLDLEKVAGQSHRERVEQFNEKLSKLTELNDIPRISAAGNG